MRRFLSGLVLAVAGLVLAGCFVSETSLIAPGDAAYPYQEIAFTQADGEDVTLVREGDDYAMTTSEGKVLLRFQLIRDNYYVVQMGSDDPSEGWLFALLDVDFAGGTANAYKVIGSESDVAPGLTLCEQVICIASVQAFADYAIAAVQAGAQPEATYTIRSTK
jgi:hypothetical protein